MNQIICYIYEYKGTNKVQNTGFLKIQQKSHSILIQMHLKGLALTNSEMLDFLIFYKEKDSAVTEHLLDLPVKNKSINMQLSLPENFFSSRKRLQECDGFLFKDPYGKIYVASWGNVPFDTSKISAYIESTETNSVHANTITPDCRKISRTEMSILPRRYWNLANNSFLLHGFYNYHHLLLVETEDSFFLGVPGLYDKKEARVADLFGFPLFNTDYISDLKLNNEECSDCKNFGYWCCSLPKKSNNTPTSFK